MLSLMSTIFYNTYLLSYYTQTSIERRRKEMKNIYIYMRKMEMTGKDKEYIR